MPEVKDEVQEAKAFLHSILEHSEQISKLKFYAKLENGAVFRYNIDRARIEREERRWETPPSAYFSAIVCTLGAALSGVAFVLMVVFSALTRDPLRVGVFSCFGGALMCAYTMGSLFYFFKPSGAKQVMGVLRSSFLYALLAFSLIPVFLVPSQNILAIILCALVVAISAAAAVIEILFWKKSVFVSALSSFAVICVGLLWFNAHSAELPNASPLLIMAAGFMNILWACFHAVEKARPTTGVFGFREFSNLASLASSTLFFFAWIGVVAGA